MSPSRPVLLLLSLAVACGGESTDGESSSTGGNDAGSGASAPSGGGTGGDAGDNTGGELTGSGGIAATGGDSSIGGNSSTGGDASTGGNPAIDPPSGLVLGDPGLPVESIELATSSSCTPPCSLEFSDDPQIVLEGAVGARLAINFDPPSATLTNDFASVSSDWALTFTFEDNQYGYSWYMSGSTDAYSVNLEYSEEEGREYSFVQDEIAMTQFVTNQLQVVQIHYSYGEELVRIHAVRFPVCDTAGAGVCENDSDCTLIDTGQSTGLGPACQDCYGQLDSCTSSNCSEVCPGSMTGNSCMRCQVDAGCHESFMACSGLDYLPIGSLRFPHSP